MAPLLVSQSLAAQHGGIQEELVFSLPAKDFITATHAGAKAEEEEEEDDEEGTGVEEKSEAEGRD